MVDLTGAQTCDIYSAISDVCTEIIPDYRDCKISMIDIAQALYDSFSREDQAEMDKILNYYCYGIEEQ